MLLAASERATSAHYTRQQWGGCPPPPRAPPPLAPRQQRVWSSYLKAQRHYAHLRRLSAERSAAFQPMHVARSGDTLLSLARACGTTPERLRALNPDLDASGIQGGDCVAIPAVPPPTLYTARAGDTLAAVAARHDLSVSRLCAHNRDVLGGCRWQRARRESLPRRPLSEGQLLELPALCNGSVSSEESSTDEVEAAWHSPSTGLINCHWVCCPACHAPPIAAL